MKWRRVKPKPWEVRRRWIVLGPGHEKGSSSPWRLNRPAGESPHSGTSFWGEKGRETRVREGVWEGEGKKARKGGWETGQRGNYYTVHNCMTDWNKIYCRWLLKFYWERQELWESSTKFKETNLCMWYECIYFVLKTKSRVWQRLSVFCSLLPNGS